MAYLGMSKSLSFLFLKCCIFEGNFNLLHSVTATAPPHHTQLFLSTNARNASPALLFELADKQRELVVHWSSMAINRHYRIRWIQRETDLRVQGLRIFLIASALAGTRAKK